MKRFNDLRVLAATIALGLLASPAVHGQTNDEANASLRFDFSNPGAASLGLGGAFTGIANDATAAYANPAGLTQLKIAEVAIEGRYSRTQNSFADGGSQAQRLDAFLTADELGNLSPGQVAELESLLARPTGLGIDTGESLLLGETTSDDLGIAFFSYVQPFKRASIALYRHELSNVDSQFRGNGAFFWECDPTPAADGGEGVCDTAGEFDRARHRPIESSTQLEVINYGLSAGFDIGKGFSLGVGVSYYEFSMQSVTNRYATDFFSDSEFRADELRSRTIQLGDSSEFGFSVGFHWDVNKKFSFGGVYRKAPVFDMEGATAVPNDPGLPFFPGVPFGTDSPGDNININTFPAEFDVPDFYSVGMAIRPSDNFLIALQYDRIEYDQLAGVADLFGVFQADGSNQFQVDSANIFRLGIEGVLADGRVLIRAGAWHDPDHDIRYVGSSQDRRTQFLAGEDLLHVTAGVGFVLGNRFTLDVGADISDDNKTFSMSFGAVVGKL
jgi:hypothetical protein